MKIAIDTGPLTSGDKIRGVGFYTKLLIDALQALAKKDKKLSIDALDSETLRQKEADYDVVHIPYFNPFFATVPRAFSSKVVVTVHDVIPLLYPEHYPAGYKGKRQLAEQIQALESVSAVITDSEASKKDIIRFLKVPQEKVVPIYLAPADHFRKITNKARLNKTKKKFKLPDTYVLYVGDVNYNKNIPMLIKACKKANLPLVIAGKQAKELDTYDNDLVHLHGPRDWVRYLFGKPHPEVAHYKNILDLLRDAKDVYRLGFVSDDELVDVYNLATIYCQPSLAEGFGLPVLEAMACGTPVVASKTQAVVEISDGAALYAGPHDEESFAQAFTKLLKSKKLMNEQIVKANKKVKTYSWSKTAKETISLYKSIS